MRSAQPHADPTPPDAISGLAYFPGRGAGTDAERRAARWLARHLEDRGREVVLEPFWCRPNWALAHSWHAALGLAGSLVSVASPRAGTAMLVAALVFVIADALTGVSPGRRLTHEHASQNVLARPRPNARPSSDDKAEERLHLLITANYDAGRAGLVYRETVRAPISALRRLTRGLAPGWLGWLTLAIVWALITAVLRLGGHHSSLIGVIQAPPTVGLVLAVALLLELAGAEWSPAAGDNGSGVEVAMALERALAVSSPGNLDVELVLTGAGDGEGIGLRRYLAARRELLRPPNTVVLGIAPCAGGTVRWWRSDGALVPLGYGGRLLALARQIAREQVDLRIRQHRGRGATPALPGRRRGIPAIAIGCLDERDLVPRSHQRDDLPPAIDSRAGAQALQFGVMLVDAIDLALQHSQAGPRGAGDPPDEARRA